MNRLKDIWSIFWYDIVLEFWHSVKQIIRPEKKNVERQLPEWEGNLKLVFFKEYIWEEMSNIHNGLPYPTYSTVYSGMKNWLEKNITEYKLLDGQVFGEEYIEGVYLLPEDIVIFKLVWGEYV